MQASTRRWNKPAITRSGLVLGSHKTTKTTVAAKPKPATHNKANPNPNPKAQSQTTKDRPGNHNQTAEVPKLVKKTKKQLLAKLNGGNDEAEAAMNQGDVQHALQIMLKTADLAQAVSTPSFGKDIDTFLERVGVKVQRNSKGAAVGFNTATGAGFVAYDDFKSTMLQAAEMHGVENTKQPAISTEGILSAAKTSGVGANGAVVGTPANNADVLQQNADTTQRDSNAGGATYWSTARPKNSTSGAGDEEQLSGMSGRSTDAPRKSDDGLQQNTNTMQRDLGAGGATYGSTAAPKNSAPAAGDENQHGGDNHVTSSAHVTLRSPASSTMKDSPSSGAPAPPAEAETDLVLGSDEGDYGVISEQQVEKTTSASPEGNAGPLPAEETGIDLDFGDGESIFTPSEPENVLAEDDRMITDEDRVITTVQSNEAGDKDTIPQEQHAIEHNTGGRDADEPNTRKPNARKPNARKRKGREDTTGDDGTAPKKAKMVKPKVLLTPEERRDNGVPDDALEASIDTGGRVTCNWKGGYLVTESGTEDTRMYTRRATEVRRIDPKESGYADKKREGFNATFQKVHELYSQLGGYAIVVHGLSDDSAELRFWVSPGLQALIPGDVEVFNKKLFDALKLEAAEKAAERAGAQGRNAKELQEVLEKLAKSEEEKAQLRDENVTMSNIIERAQKKKKRGKKAAVHDEVNPSPSATQTE